jgi:hypothetical protein
MPGMALYSGRLLLIQIKAVVRQPQKWRMALSSKHAFDLLGVAGIVSIISASVGLPTSCFSIDDSRTRAKAKREAERK